jgi:hypothetical protein
MADIREAGARIRLMAMATFPPASPPLEGRAVQVRKKKAEDRRQNA